MNVVGIIQARMGSSRLPGKVMLPLGKKHVLDHVVYRVQEASNIDQTVVATSTNSADDIVEWCAERAGATIFRGKEENVLDRMYRAAVVARADVVVRITADCPLVNPTVIDAVIERRRQTGADYASNITQRTFPRGLDVEAFSLTSFKRVHYDATEPAQLEHVTKFYQDHPNEFELALLTSEEVFDERRLQNRTDLRLTLDELPDYLLLRSVFDGIDYRETPDFADVVNYIDNEEIGDLNDAVIIKSDSHASSNQG